MPKIDTDTLPPEIRAQIDELNRPKPPLFPIAPREFNAPFGTREQKELSEKVDLLIEAVNTLHENQNGSK